MSPYFGRHSARHATKDSLLLLLADFLLRWILEDEGVEAVAHVDARVGAASLALELDGLPLDLDDSLGVEAVVALHIFLDEVLQQLHQLLGIVGAIDNGGASLLVEVGLCPQLTAIELQDVCRSKACWRPASALKAKCCLISEIWHRPSAQVQVSVVNVYL